MAAADDGTYIYIPPPPLPELYMSGVRQDAFAPAVASQSNEPPRAPKKVIVGTDGAYDGRPTAFVGCPPVMVAVPPQQGYSIPPLAIYHICRVCLRTRSARYHREHPIPINGLPPPPGICRRCRITTVESVEESLKVSDITIEGESNEIKLGFITPFVPDDAIVSCGEMKQVRADEWIERSGCQQQKERRSDHPGESTQKNITYRYVDVRDDKKYNAPSERRAKVTFFSETKATEAAKDDLEVNCNVRSKKATTSMQVQPTEKAVSKSSSISSSTSTSQTTAKAADRVVKPYPNPTDTIIRDIARDEVRRYHQESLCDEQRMDLLREIARNEVERYRQAERIIAAHPEPYAHGKMMPKKKGIAQNPEAGDSIPRFQREQRVKVTVTSSDPDKPFAVYQDERCSSQSTTPIHQSAKTPLKAAPSAQPIQQRELSIDRHEVRSRSQRTQSIERSRAAPHKQAASPTFRTPHSVSTEARVGVDAKSTTSSSRERARSQAFEIRETQYQPTQLDDIIEVVEEWETPADAIQKETIASASHDQNWWPKLPVAADPRYEATGSDERSKRQLPAESERNKSTQSRLKQSKASHDVDWQSSPRVRTIYSHSSEFMESPGTGSTPRDSARGSTRPSQRSLRLPMPGLESEPRVQDSDDKTVWQATEEVSRKSLSSASRQRRSAYERDPSVQYRIVRPTDPVEDEPARRTSSRSTSDRNDGKEYVYTERTTKPLDWENDLPFLARPPRKVVVEEWVETRKRPTPDRQTRRRRRTQDRSSSDNRDRREKWMGDDGTSEARKVRKERPEIHSNPPSQHSRRSARPLSGDDSSRVRFSDKVDYSPTPPDSDDSSSAFRSYHSIGRRSAGRTADGASSPGPKANEVETHGMRGRTSSRSRDVSTTKTGSKSSRQTHGALERALSESPSRERLMSSIADNDEYDGGGPYRPLEKPSDSMQVEDSRVSM